MMPDKQEVLWEKFRKYSRKNEEILKREDKTTKYTITINSEQRDLLEYLLRDEVNHENALFDEESHDEEGDPYTMALFELYAERAAKLKKLIKSAEPVQD